MILLRLLWYYLWIAPHVLQLGVILAMVRRGVLRQFPMFSLYSGFEVFQFGALVGISVSHLHFSPAYDYAFSIGLALSNAIRFAVIYELFRHFFRRYPLLTGPGRLVFRGGTVVLLLVAVGLAISAPSRSLSFLVNVTYTLDRTVSVLQAGLLISLFLFSGWFALSWRSDAFGIALGLGVLATLELPLSAIWLHLGAFGNVLGNLVTMGIYHGCVLIWLFYLWAPEQSPKVAVMKLPSHDLEIWNQELQRLLQQ